MTEKPAPPASAPRLTGLPPDRVRALSPEQRALWSRQVAEEDEDFHFLQGFADTLYPLLRKNFKRMRAELMDLPHKSGDVPLHAAFGHLLALVDLCQADPLFLERFRHTVARWDRRRGGEAQPQTPPAVARDGAVVFGSKREAEAFEEEWTPGLDKLGPAGWVASELLSGGLWACRVCRFVNTAGAPCAVCSKREEAAANLFDSSGTGEAMEHAESRLVSNRVAHAEGLHDQYLNAFFAAENIHYAAMYRLIREDREAGKAGLAQKSAPCTEDTERG